jgi:hypothetical protein
VPAGAAHSAVSAKHKRGGPPRIKVSGQENPRKGKPQGSYSECPCFGTVRLRGLPRGTKPRSCGSHRRASGCCSRKVWEEQQVGPLRWEHRETWREVRLRRGESQERGECETKLTRNRREEIVKRVAKPGRRNVGRGGSLSTSGPSILTCAEGNQSS